MKILCVTIDCDGHGFNILDALGRCFELFEKNSISQVTWFVNERGYHYTVDFPDLLEQMINLGEIGLHTHLNELWKYDRCIPNDSSLIYNAIEKDKECLERWFYLKGYHKRIISFRSGNLLTNDLLFTILSRVGLKVDSSILTVSQYNLREFGRKIILKLPVKARNAVCKLAKGCAYQTIPIANKPYEIGKVLEIPLNIYAGGRYLRMRWLKRHTESVFKRSEILVIYFHPYDVTVFGVSIYSEYISWILQTYKPKLSTLNDIYENYLRHQEI